MDGIDPNNEHNLENEHAIVKFARHLRSLGYNYERMHATTMIYRSLIEGTSKLIGHNHIPPPENGLQLVVCTRSDHVQQHDDVLIPAWKEFAEALASVPVRPKGYITLGFYQLQLSQFVSNILSESFKTLPLETLVLNSNDLGYSEIKFVTDVLRINSTLESLCIEGNHIRSAHNAICLMEAVVKHPTVDLIFFRNCGMGQNNDVMAAVIPAASNLTVLSLVNNAIGSHGTEVIAACLVRNPFLEDLDLSGNNLDNKDSEMIAVSLKTNTNLRCLKVVGNRFTEDGVSALGRACLMGSNLNEACQSNHTCKIILGDAYGAVGTFVSCMNRLHDPMLNKKFKLMTIIGLIANSAIKYHYIDNIPLKMMPKVLEFIHGEAVMYQTIYTRLDRLFQLTREWSMPLLYTSRNDHEKRRSERIRKNRTKELMAKK